MPPGFRRALLAAAAGAALGLIPATAAARGGTASLQSGPRVVIVFLPGPHGAVMRQLGSDRSLPALGLLSPTEIDYNQQQALVDITQGVHVVHGDYGPAPPEQLSVRRDGTVMGWPEAVRRAHRAPAQAHPGLLAGAVPGGVGYAAAAPSPQLDALVAADRRGRIAAVSLGDAATLAARTIAMLKSLAIVVVDLPANFAGRAPLDALLARRTPGELVLVIERPPPTAATEQLPPRLLAAAVAGLPGGAGLLAARTTRLPGLVTALDIAPTALAWLARPKPRPLTGAMLRIDGRRDPAALARFGDRLAVIGGRRNGVIAAFLLAWAALVALAGLAVRGRGIRSALRTGALAALWSPSTMLLAGTLDLSRAAETAVIVGGSLVLGAVTDRLVAWPRGPAVPGFVAVAAYTIDLARDSPLIARSLLGPNPLLGARFFGIGNELEAALPIVLFGALAAVLPARAANNRDAALFGAAGLGFTAVVAAGRLGADVGALFTIGGGTAAAVVLLSHGGVTRRKALYACLVPLAGLGVLALVDLLTASGSHYSRTVLHAGSLNDELDTARRKLTGAWHVLKGGTMPLQTTAGLGAAAWAIRSRAWLLRPVADAAAWRASLGGGLAGSLLGSVTNDSGPQLFVIGTFGLACLVAYIRGAPRPESPALLSNS